jgi:hypothetical protein
MKLLFDQNLSFRLCDRLVDLFPGTCQVRLVGLGEAEDRAVWDYAKANGLILVSLDFGLCRNGGIARVAAQSHLAALRQPAYCRHRESASHQAEAIVGFEQDAFAACLEIYSAPMTTSARTGR